MSAWLKCLLLILLFLCGGSACQRDETKNWVKSWGWSDDRYGCQLYGFGNRAPCAALISRVNHGDAGFQITTGVDWAQVNGIKVVDDGKLTVHWMNGNVHRMIVLESGPLYDALRAPPGQDGPSRERPEDALLNAFFADQSK